LSWYEEPLTVQVQRRTSNAAAIGYTRTIVAIRSARMNPSRRWRFLRDIDSCCVGVVVCPCAGFTPEWSIRYPDSAAANTPSGLLRLDDHRSEYIQILRPHVPPKFGFGLGWVSHPMWGHFEFASKHSISEALLTGAMNSQDEWTGGCGAGANEYCNSSDRRPLEGMFIMTDRVEHRLGFGRWRDACQS